MKQLRDSRGRYAKRYQQASRWERLIIVGVILGQAVGVGLDAFSQKYLVPLVYAQEIVEEEVVEPKTVLIAVEIDWTEERIKKEVWDAAARYNTFPEKMWDTIQCENPALDPELQSLIVKDGVREDSWGLAQFYLPAKNKTAEGQVISKEMAQDPEIALDAMAYHFSEGRAHLWTCYRNIYM